MISVKPGNLGEICKENQVFSFLIPASLAADECLLGSWPLARPASLCENQWIHICAAPRCGLSTSTFQAGGLSWYCLPSLVQRTEATWPAEPNSASHRDLAVMAKKGKNRVHMFMQNQSAFLLYSVLELLHRLEDKEALCILQCGALFLSNAHSGVIQPPITTSPPSSNPQMQCEVVLKKMTKEAIPRRKSAKPRGSEVHLRVLIGFFISGRS